MASHSLFASRTSFSLRCDPSKQLSISWTSFFNQFPVSWLSRSTTRTPSQVEAEVLYGSPIPAVNRLLENSPLLGSGRRADAAIVDGFQAQIPVNLCRRLLLGPRSSVRSSFGSACSRPRPVEGLSDCSKVCISCSKTSCSSSAFHHPHEVALGVQGIGSFPITRLARLIFKGR